MTDRSKYEAMAREVCGHEERFPKTKVLACMRCDEIVRALERAALEELKYVIRLVESADHRASSKADAYKLGVSLLRARLKKLTETAECPHEHLNMEGICHKCGADKRGIG